MAKQMVIDGIIYVVKDEYDKEIADTKSREFLKANSESMIKALSETNHHSFMKVVKESVREQVKKFNHGYFDYDIIDEKEEYNGKHIHQKLLMVALSLQE